MSNFTPIRLFFLYSPRVLSLLMHYKVLVIFFYILGGYQNFTPETIVALLRISITVDVIIILFSIFTIIKMFVYNCSLTQKFITSAIGIINVIFSFVTLVTALMLLVLGK